MPTLKIVNPEVEAHLVFHYNVGVPKIDRKTITVTAPPSKEYAAANITSSTATTTSRRRSTPTARSAAPARTTTATSLVDDEEASVAGSSSTTITPATASTTNSPAVRRGRVRTRWCDSIEIPPHDGGISTTSIIKRSNVGVASNAIRADETTREQVEEIANNQHEHDHQQQQQQQQQQVIKKKRKYESKDEEDFNSKNTVSILITNNNGRDIVKESRTATTIASNKIHATTSTTSSANRLVHLTRMALASPPIMTTATSRSTEKSANGDKNKEEGEKEEQHNPLVTYVLAPIWSPTTAMMKTWKNRLVLRWCPVCYTCKQRCRGRRESGFEETSKTMENTKTTNNENDENGNPPALTGNKQSDKIGTSGVSKRRNKTFGINNESNFSKNVLPPKLSNVYNERVRRIIPPSKHRDAFLSLKGGNPDPRMAHDHAHHGDDGPRPPSGGAHCYQRSTVPPPQHVGISARPPPPPPIPPEAAHTHNASRGGAYYNSNDPTRNGFHEYPPPQRGGGEHYRCNYPPPRTPQQQPQIGRDNYTSYPQCYPSPPQHHRDKSSRYHSNSTSSSSAYYCYDEQQNSREPMAAPRTNTNERRQASMFRQQAPAYYPNRGHA